MILYVKLFYVLAPRRQSRPRTEDRSSLSADAESYFNLRPSTSSLDLQPPPQDFGFLSPSQCAELSDKLGNLWPHLGSLLGLESTVIDRIKIDNPQALDQARAMLVEWQTTFSSDPHTQKQCLINALKKARRDDIAEFVERG